MRLNNIKKIMTLSELLQDARSGLIDLSFRNPLLNYKPLKNRGLEFTSDSTIEKVESLFDLRSDIQSHINFQLNSFHNFYTPAQVESRVKITQSDAKLHIQEKGVNVLFLACCFLHWKEDERAEMFNKSPLVLIPVTITITTGHDVEITRIEDDIQENFALKEKLKKVGVNLPHFNPNDKTLSSFINEINELCNRQNDWSIETSRISIDIFKTQKYLMYEDLNPNNWDEIETTELPELISKLVTKEIFQLERLDILSTKIDELNSDEEPVLVRDADLSQLQAILFAHQDNTFVIQGPPGTGKSQTITNLIANLLSRGKLVLFVSEKSTALEVVKSNLDLAGLGSLILDLHSTDSKKTNILQDINNTLEFSKTFTLKNKFSEHDYNDIKNELRQYRLALNTAIGSTDFKPEFVLTELSESYAKFIALDISHSEVDLELSKIEYSPDELQTIEYRENIQFLSQLDTHLTAFNTLEESCFSVTNFKNHDVVDVVAIKKSANAILQLLPTNTETSDTLVVLHKELNNWFALIQTTHSPQVLNIIKTYKLWDKNWINKQAELIDITKKISSLMAQKKDYSSSINNKTWNLTSIELVENIQKIKPSYLKSYVPGNKRKYFTECLEYFHGPLTEVKIKGYLRVHCSYRDKFDNFITDLKSSAFNQFQELINKDIDHASNILGELLKIMTLIESDKDLYQIYSFDSYEVEKLLSLNSCSDDDYEQSDMLKYRIKLSALTGNTNLPNYTNSQLKSFCEVMIQSSIKIDSWRNLEKMKEKLIHQELKWLLDHKIHSLQFVYRYITMKKIEAIMHTKCPIISKYSGVELESLRGKFATLDKERKSYSRDKILELQNNSVANLSLESSKGFKILLREINKKRNVLTIRNILSQCFEEVSVIKPIMMMSPITVSSFIPRKTMAFDYVIFDEASQIKPSDAIGAILRGKNTVIVGDKMQLPPTNMFDVDSTDDIDYADKLDVDSIDAKDLAGSMKNHESILDLANGLNVPEKKLNWHYRSRFNSLINLSNEKFYNRSLVVFPDASLPGANEGLQFEFIQNGNYDRSGTRKNENEADVVITEVIEHLKNRKSRSLGVATFSMAQKSAIEDKLMHSQETRELISEYNKIHANEKFFVKNIETIQGDERDSIFISVGYGKSVGSASKTISFGPLSQQNGDRRLNVLISRAKYQCKVFSSIHYFDIDTDGNQNQGVAKLKAFLKYAETGEMDTPKITGEDYDSEFERSVASELTKIGYEVVCQVGSAGFKIDLAIKCPDYPGKYLCGIECDGATYHSSLSARERDRIRQEILESKGWKILRIWSTDWFRNKELEIGKIDKNIKGLSRRA